LRIEEGSNNFLRKVDDYLSGCMTLYPRTAESSFGGMWNKCTRKQPTVPSCNEARSRAKKYNGFANPLGELTYPKNEAEGSF
jgi:hypothetical protein